MIVAGWVVFAAYWIASARALKATAVRQPWAERLTHTIPLFIGAILLFRSRLPNPVGAVLIPHTILAESLAVGICGLGLLEALWSRHTLASNWSGAVALKEDHELVESGPYRFVRHPIYASVLLMIVGSAISRGTLAAFLGVAFFVVGVWVKARQEEALRLRHFPERYLRYQTRAQRLVPFVNASARGNLAQARLDHADLSLLLRFLRALDRRAVEGR